MPRDDDRDDRPKKSWREIDQAREKNSQRRDTGVGGNSRLERSQAYRSYKSQLNKLFDGGMIPQAMQEKLGTQGLASHATARKEALARILTATTSKTTQVALEVFTEAHGFPDDEEVLAKVLDMGQEAAVLQAIHTVANLHAEGRLKRAASFKARLKTAQLTQDDPEIRSAAAALLAKL